jgi:predicted RNA-binding protein with PIN domain
MHLIIDGYNVIRQSPALQRLDARELEAGREALLDRLAAYRSRTRHKITVVFDGWQGGGLKESRAQQQGMLIIYSRLGERGRAVVVSSDRELQERARQVGAAWINAAQFDRLHLLPRDHRPPDQIEEPTRARRGKKGPARRLPKAQRQQRQRLKKL